MWKDGLRDRHIQPILHILDGQHVFLYTVTGDEQSAACQTSHHSNQGSGSEHCLDVFSACTRSSHIFILGVETLTSYGISALAYDHENFIHVSSQRRDLLKFIDAPKFQQNIIFFHTVLDQTFTSCTSSTRPSLWIRGPCPGSSLRK
jgi:hypothetical protein